MKTTLTGYDKQAVNFLKATNTEFKAELLRNDYHFDNDKLKRDIYNITLKRGNRSFSFEFGQSNVNSQYYFDKTSKRKYTEGKEYFESIDSGKSKKHYKDMFLKYISNSSMFINTINDIKALKRFGFLKEGTSPTEYDILACLTKYDPETFENFCDEFGYDTDSKSAEKTYNAVVNEYKNVAMLWNDSEIEQLAEIQ